MRHSSIRPTRESGSRVRGAFEVAGAGLAFGFLGVFGKLALQNGLSIGELLAWRFALAATLLAGALFVFSPRRLKISIRDALACAALGTFGYAVFASLYFQAIEGVSIAIASLLLYTYPIIVATFAHIVFKERLTRTQWLALPLVAIGLAILLAPGETTHSRNPLAIAAGFGAAACYSAYILVSSRLQKSIDPITSGLYVMVFAALCLFAIHRPDPLRLFALNLNQYAIILGIGVICTILPLILFLSGLQKLGNTEASILSTIEPVTAALMGAIILRESMGAQEIFGGAIVMVALLTTVLGGRKKSTSGSK